MGAYFNLKLPSCLLFRIGIPQIPRQFSYCNLTLPLQPIGAWLIEVFAVHEALPPKTGKMRELVLRTNTR